MSTTTSKSEYLFFKNTSWWLLLKQKKSSIGTFYHFCFFETIYQILVINPLLTKYSNFVPPNNTRKPSNIQSLQLNDEIFAKCDP